MEGGEIFDNTVSDGAGYGGTGGGSVFFEGVTFIMKDGEISGNTANYGGGVGVNDDNATFKKQPAPGRSNSGIIYGYSAGDPKSNNSFSANKGPAVYIDSSKKRTSTAGENIFLDSTQTGAAGGWDS
jgi:hypothetical protein